MRLFIAEKPSVAKAIAGELGVTGKGDGFIECGQDKITWCFGHMLEQAGSDEYTDADVPTSPKTGKKIWRIEDLPIIPTTWIMHPKDDAKKQLAAIGKLLKSAAQVVHCGDPDREGQELVNLVLEHFDCTKPVLRFWVNAQDSTSIQRGLASLKDNAPYEGFGAAARARGRADWLIGMNLSRAYTLRAQRGGSAALLTVGRVQTPTLALVVARDREIEAFKPVPYHTIHAEIQHEKGKFIAKWEAREDQDGLDSEGRLVSTAIGNAIIQKVEKASGCVTEYRQELKKNHPKAYSLSDITLVASNQYGYTAAQVLEACQALYETHKLASYPRTDCSFLPESQHADAGLVLAAVRHVNPQLAALVDAADTSIKSKTWDDKKITAHHGIIPTMHHGNAGNLSDIERNIYNFIVRAYVAQFYPIHEYMSTVVTVDLDGELFRVSGQVISRNGWRDVYTGDDTEEGEEATERAGNQILPTMAQGDSVSCGRTKRTDTKTTAPSRFTEGTLQRAMENIHKFVPDSEHKKMLRDGDGIGTSATRPSVISELKRRQFLASEGKAVISTTLGRSLVDALPEVVKSPVLTALFERMLKGIEQGTSQMDSFIQKQEQFIREQVAKANTGSIKIAGAKEAPAVSTTHKCSECGKGLVRRPSTKKKGMFWWGCSNYPACNYVYPDVKGQPDHSKRVAREKTANPK